MFLPFTFLVTVCVRRTLHVVAVAGAMRLLPVIAHVLVVVHFRFFAPFAGLMIEVSGIDALRTTFTLISPAGNVVVGGSVAGATVVGATVVAAACWLPVTSVVVVAATVVVGAAVVVVVTGGSVP